MEIKRFSCFEWNIPGDSVGDPGMMGQSARLPDTLWIPKINDEWEKPIKRKKKNRRAIRKERISEMLHDGSPLTFNTELSNETIILRIQAGDYHGASELIRKLEESPAETEEDQAIIDGTLERIRDYISNLEPDRVKEIQKALNSDDLPTSRITPRNINDSKMSLNKYREFSRSINEQAVNTTNIKTIDFPSLITAFENLVAKKEVLSEDEKKMQTDLRGEILSRYAKTGAKP